MSEKKSSTIPEGVLDGRPDAFWESVHVYPRLLRESGGVKDFRAQTLAALKKAGLHNLLLILERLGLPQLDEPRPEGVAAHLLSRDANSTLVALAEFVRGKGRAINEEYERLFKENVRRKHLSQLRELSNRSNASLSQFTKLVLLYREDPNSVRRIFVRRLWRRRPTLCEFVSDYELSSPFLKSVVQKRKKLADAISDAFSGFDLRFFDNVDLGPFQVMLFQREYAPVVRPDYRDTQKTIHGVGWVMLGFEKNCKRLLIKGGGKRVLGLVKTWFEHELQVNLQAHVEEDDTFGAYDPLLVEKSLLGESDSTTLRLTGMQFRRSLLPKHSPITIEPAFPGMDIHRDLQYGREHGFIRVRTLSDIAWFKVSIKGKEARVDVEVEAGGGVTLKLNNVDLSEEDVDEARNAFKQDFGIPLDRRIDPQRLLLGSIDVFNRLLELDRADDLADYQASALQTLLKDGILEVDAKEIIACPKPPFICKAGGKAVVDEDLAECPECQTALEVRKVNFLLHCDKEIIKQAGDFLAKATGLKFSKRSSAFEGEKFFPLSDPKRPEQVIRVYFSKRIGNRLLQLLDRSLQPVLVVHTGGHVEHTHLDQAGVAHVSFARALASKHDPEIGKRFKEDCQRAVDDLLIRQSEKVLRRAAASRHRIVDPPAEYHGSDFELDVFNLIRSIFPYTEFWAGTNRPDGFCSLVHFEDASLRKPRKHNWSYDAKFTADAAGYDLNAGEERKAWDYVAALASRPDLSEQDNSLNGHAIISNRLRAPQMKKLSDFLQREHRLGKDYSHVKAIFIDSDFIIELFDRVRESEESFRKRWTRLSQRMAHIMNSSNGDGYVHLDKQAAQSLVKWVLEHGEVENPVNIKRLRRDLDEAMKS